MVLHICGYLFIFSLEIIQDGSLWVAIRAKGHLEVLLNMQALNRALMIRSN